MPVGPVLCSVTGLQGMARSCMVSDPTPLHVRRCASAVPNCAGAELHHGRVMML